MWSEPPTDNELAREAELRSSDQFFGMPLSQGAQMCRHNNTQESAHNIIRKVLPRPPNVTKLAEELNRGVPLEQTRAGAALGLGLEEEIRKLTEELKELQEDHAQAIRENNEKHQKMIEDMKRKAESDREILQAEIRSLKQGYQKHREDWSKVTSNLEQKYKEQLQAARKSEDQRMEDLKKAYDKALAEARSQPQNKCIII
ncbi:hypothetical protein OPQ81_010674 [Rhizoctonia solani]|nr:hypothetical protein OPQ81_010674 [Rhizoctonia solani]